MSRPCLVRNWGGNTASRCDADSVSLVRGCQVHHNDTQVEKIHITAFDVWTWGGSRTWHGGRGRLCSQGPISAFLLVVTITIEPPTGPSERLGGSRYSSASNAGMSVCQRDRTINDSLRSINMFQPQISLDVGLPTEGRI
jgi:hypothetical protein